GSPRPPSGGGSGPPSDGLPSTRRWPASTPPSAPRTASPRGCWRRIRDACCTIRDGGRPGTLPHHGARSGPLLLFSHVRRLHGGRAHGPPRPVWELFLSSPVTARPAATRRPPGGVARRRGLLTAKPTAHGTATRIQPRPRQPLPPRSGGRRGDRRRSPVGRAPLP